MCTAIALNVCYTFLCISLPFFATQQREMTNSKLYGERGQMMVNFVWYVLTLNAAPTNSAPG